MAIALMGMNRAIDAFSSMIRRVLANDMAGFAVVFVNCYLRALWGARSAKQIIPHGLLVGAVNHIANQ